VRFFLLFLFFFSSPTFCAWFFLPADVNALHSADADKRIHYGKAPFQYADLRLPKNKGPHPVAIILHGGCWTGEFASLKNTAALADALRELGFATWNVEYRRIGDVGGGWPGTFADVADATDYLRQIKEQYQLNLNKVIVLGHSAGGHLALWVAGRHHLSAQSPLYRKEPLTVRGVIGLGAIPDLKAFRKESVSVCNRDVIADLLGTQSQALLESRYQETSPADLLPLSSEQILIYGTEDKVTPPQLKDYVHAAKQSGNVIKVIKIPGAAHHEYNVPNSIVWPVLIEQIQALIHDAPLAVG
jgi:acetyl esterase/lipase